MPEPGTLLAIVALLAVFACFMTGMWAEARDRYESERKSHASLERWCLQNDYACYESLGFLNTEVRYIPRDEFIAALKEKEAKVNSYMDNSSGMRAAQQRQQQRQQAEAAPAPNPEDTEVRDSDAKLLATSLNMRANWIETGNITLSASDAVGSGQSHLIRPLTPNQQELVARLRELAATTKEL